MTVEPLAAEPGCAIVGAMHDAMAQAVAEAEAVLRRHFSRRTIADLAQAMVQGVQHKGDFRFPPR